MARKLEKSDQVVFATVFSTFVVYTRILTPEFLKFSTYSLTKDMTGKVIIFGSFYSICTLVVNFVVI